MEEPVFNNPNFLSRSWYLLIRSNKVPKQKAVSVQFYNKSLVVFRGKNSRVSVLSGFCPHFGAHLGKGKVIENAIQCPFHHWKFDQNGRCIDIPHHKNEIPNRAKIFSYPVEEKFGCIWIFNGEEPLFPLPNFPIWKGKKTRMIPLKEKNLKCHPHLLTVNGLDIQHFQTVHHLEFSKEPKLIQPTNYKLELNIQIKISQKNIFEKLVYFFSKSNSLNVTFSTWGSNIATIDTNIGNLAIQVMFTHRLTLNGGSHSQTLIFLSEVNGLARLFGLDFIFEIFVKFLLVYILVGDIRVLEELRFQKPLFLKQDAFIRKFIKLVNNMGSFSCERQELI